MSRNIYNRQEPLSILVQLTPDDIAGGGFSAKIPRGALVTNVYATKNTAFNTAGDTPVVTLNVTDGTTTFISAESLAGTGAITVDVTKKFYPTGGTITGAITESVSTGEVTSATAGDAVVYIEYVQLGRGCEIQG